MAFKLRDYQEETLEKLEEHLAFDEKAVIPLPGGGGKSALIAELARIAQTKKEHCVVLTNLSALISQLSRHLDEMQVKHSIVKAGQHRSEPDCYVTLIMEQSFHENKREEIDVKCDILLKDEYHIGVGQKRYEKIVEHLKPKHIVGFTFTPYDEKGYLLSDLKPDNLVPTVGVRELTNMGFLAPIRYFVPKWSEKLDYTTVNDSGNDFNGREIDEIINTNENIDFALKSMEMRNAKNKKTLVYCSSIEHADAMYKALTENGYKCGIVHSKLDKKQNEETIKAFKEENQDSLVHKEINCLLSVMSLGIGFDAPQAQLLVMMRATKVRRLAMQILARISRPYEGKEYGEVLDLAQTVRLHGFLEEEDFYHPPKKGDKEALMKEKAKLEAPIIEHIVLDEPTEVTRKLIVDKIEEIKRAEQDIPKMPMQTLASMFEMTTNIEAIIHIGYEVHKRVHGSKYKDDHIPWATEPWLKMIDEFPQYKGRIIRTMKTRIKNIVRDSKKMHSIHFFPDWLRKQEPYTFHDNWEINDEDIPF